MSHQRQTPWYKLSSPLISHLPPSLSLCLTATRLSILAAISVVLSWEILDWRKLIRKVLLWSFCLYTHTYTHTVRADTHYPRRQMCPAWDMEKNVLGFGFHHAALRELTILMPLNLCHGGRFCAHTCAFEHVCMCAYMHNVFMDVIIQPSSEILFSVFISRTSSVCLGLKRSTHWCWKHGVSLV